MPRKRRGGIEAWRCWGYSGTQPLKSTTAPVTWYEPVFCNGQSPKESVPVKEVLGKHAATFPFVSREVNLDRGWTLLGNYSEEDPCLVYSETARNLEWCWDKQCPELGVFAFRLRERAIREAWEARLVYGRVLLFGQVHEHIHGYRAENCLIQELWVPHEWMIEPMQKRYQCDVHLQPERAIC